jgi:hypothetical protein
MRFAPWMLCSGLALVWVTTAFSCKTPNEGNELTVTYAAESTVVETVAESGSGGMSATTGTGGMGGAGGMSATTSSSGPASTAMSSTMSSSSTGGFAEQAINGCCSGNNPNCIDLDPNAPGKPVATPKDLTDTGKYGQIITINYVGLGGKDGTSTITGVNELLTYPICLKVKASQTIKFTSSGAKGSALMISGAYDIEGDTYAYDKNGVVQPNCYNGNFDPNNVPGCWNGGQWPCGRSGAGLSPNATCAGQAAQQNWQPGANPFYNIANSAKQHGTVYIVP